MHCNIKINLWEHSKLARYKRGLQSTPFSITPRQGWSHGNRSTRSKSPSTSSNLSLSPCNFLVFGLVHDSLMWVVLMIVDAGRKSSEMAVETELMFRLKHRGNGEDWTREYEIKVGGR